MTFSQQHSVEPVWRQGTLVVNAGDLSEERQPGQI
jgi:hypothetical protein